MVSTNDSGHYRPLSTPSITKKTHGTRAGSPSAYEVKAYVDLFGVVDVEEFVALIRAADGAYLGARGKG
jgi:hypothetical protein